MKILDPSHPFFRPLGVRVAITVFCFGWALFEAFSGATFWAIIFGAIGMMCAYEFFINTNNSFDPPADSPTQDDK